MTRNKLMAKIEYRFEEDNHHLLKDALRAVVEMHSPMVLEGSPHSNKCYGCGYTYPCPTVWAIEKGLK